MQSIEVGSLFLDALGDMLLVTVEAVHGPSRSLWLTASLQTEMPENLT